MVPGLGVLGRQVAQPRPASVILQAVTPILGDVGLGLTYLPPPLIGLPNPLDLANDITPSKVKTGHQHDSLSGEP